MKALKTSSERDLSGFFHAVEPIYNIICFVQFGICSLLGLSQVKKELTIFELHVPNVELHGKRVRVKEW